MDDMPIKLASLRLAPVQATSWGHPTTSGLPSIDYFLSSELMEPPNADEHYTEHLIRLPNLSIYYTPPATPHFNLTRTDIGVRPNEVMYWCCQNLIKYLPQYDDIFPQIAEQVGDCRFVFIRYGYGTAVTAVFAEPLEGGFRAPQSLGREALHFSAKNGLRSFHGRRLPRRRVSRRVRMVRL